MTTMPEPLDIAALREALARWNADEPAWPRRQIDQDGTCDACSESKRLVAAYDSPDGEHEPWVCAECDSYANGQNLIQTSLPALLSEVEAERERGRALRAAVEAALAIRRGHQDSLPPGFEDRCECIACDMARALLAAHVPSPLPDGDHPAPRPPVPHPRSCCGTSQERVT